MFLSICVASGSLRLAAEPLISEIMFHPLHVEGREETRHEYIELHNPGETDLSLAGYAFTRGVSFAFAEGDVLPARGFLVVAADPVALAELHPDLVGARGPWEGSLSNSGEEIRLEDGEGKKVSAVAYSDDGDWAVRGTRRSAGVTGFIWESGADGNGRSLELVNGALPLDSGQNWVDSLPGGTPGAMNSGASSLSAPIIRKLKHTPAIPRSSDSVVVTVELEGTGAEDEEISGTLYWRAGGEGAFENSAMVLRPDGLRFAVIPPQSSGTVVEFYVVSSNGTETRDWPYFRRGGLFGPSIPSHALYRVDDRFEESDEKVYHLIMREDDYGRFGDRSDSDAEFNTTLIVTRGETSEIRYRCGTRVRGHGSRRFRPRPKRVEIPKEDRLDGFASLNLNTVSPVRQFLGYQLMTAAGLVAYQAQLVPVFHNGEDKGIHVQVEPLNGDFVKRHYPNDDGGNAYRKRETDLRTTEHWGVYFRGDVPTLGYEREGWQQRDNWAKQTNAAENDWSDLQRFAEVMYESEGDSYLESVSEVIDLDQWVRWFAMMAFFNNWETSLSTGYDDDYGMYAGVADPRFQLLPHDLDSILESSRTEGTLFRAGQIPQLVTLFAHPEVERRFHAELKDLAETVFEDTNFAAFVRQQMAMSPMLAQDDDTAETAIEIMRLRRSFILSEIEPEPLQIDSDVPGVFVASEPMVTLTGRYSTVTTSQVFVGGEVAELNPVEGTWSIRKLFGPGISSADVIALNEAGETVDQASVRVWVDQAPGEILTGALTENRSLSENGGPYLIEGELTVPDGVVLTVAPGATLYFAADAKIVVNGVFRAEGEEHKRIRLMGQPSLVNGNISAVPHWGGIQFVDSMSDQNLLRHVDIRYARTLGGSVGAVNSQVAIENALFVDTNLRMVYARASSMRIEHCRFASMFGASESPLTLGLDNVAEPIKAVGGIPEGGHFVIRGNHFGTTKGHNDIIDIDGSRLPGPVLQILDNVFEGSGDDVLDLSGDVYIAGNVFRNVAKDRSNTDRGYASVVSISDALPGTTVVMSRNVFEDVDHVINLKNGARAIFEYNTVNGVNPDAEDRFGVMGINSVINFYVDEPFPSDPGYGAYLGHNVIKDVPRVFGNTNEPAGVVTVLEDVNNARAPIAEGESVGAGVSAGLMLSGEPDGMTASNEARLTVSGPGIFAYQYRLDDGPWSETHAIGSRFDGANGTVREAVITLTDLTEGSHQVEVRGRDFAGVWQDPPTLSSPWTVAPGLELEVRLNEVYMGSGDDRDAVELHHAGAASISLSGFRLTDDLSRPERFVFGAGVTMAPGAFLVVSGEELGFGLDPDGESLFLLDAGGVIVDALRWGGQIPGFSVGRVADHGWVLTTVSLGQANTRQVVGDPSYLRINEWLASTGVGFERDFIELFNPLDLPVALDGLYLTDDPINKPKQFPLAPLSFIPAKGYATFYPTGKNSGSANVANFQLSREYEWLSLTSNRGEIDKVAMLQQRSDVSYGRVPDGQSDMASFDFPTPGLSNEPDPGAVPLPLQSLLGQLRISELLFHAPEGRPNVEFIELVNTGSQPLDLEGVRFVDGVEFTFDALVLEPFEMVLVVADREAFESVYGADLQVAGEYDGMLSNGGEQIALALPEPYEQTILRFTYRDEWVPEADGGGASLIVSNVLEEREAWRDDGFWHGRVAPDPGSLGPPVLVSALTVSGVQGEPLTVQLQALSFPESYGVDVLPEGLTLNESTGLIEGIPVVFGDFDIQVTVSNGNGAAQSTLKLSLAEKFVPEILLDVEYDGFVSVPFELPIMTTHGPNSVTVTGLPRGLIYDADESVITGVVLEPGESLVMIAASNFRGTEEVEVLFHFTEDERLTALEANGLSVASGSGWRLVSEPTHDGVDALEFVVGGPEEVSSLETTVLGPDTLTFWWRMDDREGDRLLVSLNGRQEDVLWRWGEVGWHHGAIRIPDGEHQVRWAYVEDETFPDESPGAWLDDVRLASESRPEILSGSASRDFVGREWSYQIEARNAPVSYDVWNLPEWLQLSDDGLLTGALPQEAGTFAMTLVAENESGMGSRLLELTVAEEVDGSTSVLTPGLAFESVGMSPWTVDPDFGRDGNGSLRSGAASYEDPASVLRATIEGPDELIFYFQAPDVEHSVSLRVKVEGGDTQRYSSTEAWQEVRVPIPVGSRMVEVWAEDQLFWIDQFRLASDGRPFVSSSEFIAYDATEDIDHRFEIENGGTISPADPMPDGLELVGRRLRGTLEPAGLYEIDFLLNNASGSHTHRLTIDVVDLTMAVASEGLTLRMSPEAPWTHVADGVDGDGSLRSGPIEYGESSWIEANVAGPDVLRFWWKVSSEWSDFVQVYLDGEGLQRLDEERSWRETSVEIPDGEHVVRWEYQKDSSYTLGEDSAWVDAIRLDSDTRPFVKPLGDLVAYVGQPFAFQVEVTNGTGDLVVLEVPWLEIDVPGVVSGVPPAVGRYEGVLLASNAEGEDRRKFQIDVIDPSVATNSPVPRVWRNEDDSPWRTTLAHTFDGDGAFESGATGKGDVSSIETTVTGPDQLRFAWKVDSYTNNDLECRLGWRTVASLNGERDWREVLVDIPEGEHVLKWAYDRRFSDSVGENRGWVDAIQFASDPGPFVTSASRVLGVTQEPFAYKIEAKEAPTLIEVSGLPEWLTLSQDGWLRGVPSEEQVVEVNVVASDAEGSGSMRLRIGIWNRMEPEAASVTSGLVWTTGGDAPWQADEAVSADGSRSLGSGPIDDNEESWVEVTVTGPDQLVYKANVSAEDFLRVELDGNWVRGFGRNQWEENLIEIPEGEHRVRWTYQKDDAFTHDDDRAWIDDVRLLSRDPRPVIQFPEEVIGYVGQTFEYQVEAGEGPARFEPVDVPDWLTVSEAGVLSGVVPNEYLGDRVTVRAIGETGFSEGSLFIRFRYPLDVAPTDATPGLVWIQSEDGWAEDSSDGFGDARSLRATDESAWFETTVTGPQELMFAWRMEAGLGARIEFEVDGRDRPAVLRDASLGWQQERVLIPEGEHQVRWSFENVDEGESAWVDQIRFLGMDARPVTDAVTRVNAFVGQPFDYQIDWPEESAVFQLLARPAWVSVSEDGRITGTPPSRESFGVRFKLTNPEGDTYHEMAIPVLEPLDSILTGSDEDLVFYTSGLFPWGVVGERGNETPGAFVSARQVPLFEESWLATDLEGPGILSFWIKVDGTSPNGVLVEQSNAGNSYLSQIGPEWQQKWIQVGAGMQTVRWVHLGVEDPSVVAWLDYVRFTAEPEGYAAWRQEHQTSSRLLDDLDGDGFPNLLEFSLGLDPWKRDRPILAAPSQDGDMLVFDLPISSAVDGVRYVIEASNDLSEGSWGQVGEWADPVTLQILVPKEASQRYFRMRVIRDW